MSRRRTIATLAAALSATLLCGATAQQVPTCSTTAGMPIWEFPDDDADRATVAVLVAVGARDEAEEHAGIAHFLEHTLFLATEQRPGATADRGLTARGLSYNGYTTSEETVYYVTGRAEHWRYMVDWLADHVVRPRFDPAAVEVERRIVLEEILTTGPDFDALTFEHLLYGDHPIARSIGGSSRTIEAITVDDLREFHRRHYHAGNMAVGFSGRVPSEECAEALRAAFADVAAGSRTDSAPPTPRTGDLWRAGGFGGVGSLHVGYHLQADGPEDLASMLVIEAHLRRRFFDVAREERQLAYAPSVQLTWGRDAQRIEFGCDTGDRGNVGELAAIVDELIDALQDLDDEDVGRAITAARGELRCSSARDLTDALELAAWTRARGGAPNELLDDLDATTPARVAAAARRQFVDDRRFSLSSEAVIGLSADVRGWLFLLLVGALLALWFYGRRMRDGVKAAFARRTRRPAGQLHAMRAPAPPPTTSVDAVERDIQRFFAAEDEDGERRRDGDGPAGPAAP